ncbi:cupin domain-containing protein [Dethiothermospora halolimnae]|uniref:cupin domain-containing protein n=1 Tax=Dethiothermospora halolimnae TaxID=3114390 RepID=UPI003CCB8D45
MNIKGNVSSLFCSIDKYWSPKVIAEVNEDYIKIAKFKGEIVWHIHENEDEMFYVIKGNFDLHLEDEVITLNEGDYYVVKKGIKHRPMAKEECWVMLIEKKETKHTGKVITDITKSIEDQLE